MHRQKKTTLGVTGLTLLFILLAAGLLATGCEQSTSPDPEPRGEGVLGQLYGVVVDSVTGQPLEGVEVALRGSGLKATTDAKGAYLIKDVPVGMGYVLTYTKALKGTAGEIKYRFHTKDNVNVDPEQYKNDDPFAEYEALKGQLEALKLPDFPATASTPSLTYQGGIWVKEDGTAVQAVNGVMKDVEMDFTYRIGQGLSVVRLAPLTGGIKGTIKLFQVVYADRKNVALQDAVAAGEGTQFWLQESLPGGATGNTYGPFTTDASGAIDAKDLPVGTNMTLTTNGFVSGAHYYKALSPAYTYDGTSNDFVAVAASFFTTLEGQAQLQPVYLFAEPDYALVTAFTAGTSAAPLTRTGTITLTFTKAIDPATFSAELRYSNATTSASSVPLLASWSTPTTVTLKGGLETGGFMEGFSYSTDGGLPVGRLDIKGKATDGSIIFAVDDNDSATGLPVFTQEGLKVLLDLAPTDIPASRAAISAKAVKLTFNKAVDPLTASFQWGSDDADYTFVAPGNTSVFVWTDVLTSTGKILSWNVSAAADPLDTVSGNTGSENFTKAQENRPLTLDATNIYAARTDSGPITSSTEANFPVDGNITLTFTRAIPAGSMVQAALSKSSLSDFSTSLTLAASYDGAIVTIDPAADMEANTVYYLRLQITKGMETLFSPSGLSAYNSTLVYAQGGNIRFKTHKEEKLQLKGTNLYANRTDSGTITSSTEGNFPVGTPAAPAAITLTFTKGIPAGSIVKAALKKLSAPSSYTDSIPLTVSTPDGNNPVLTITPGVKLDVNTQYYLRLEITKGTEPVFEPADLSSYDGSLLAVDTDYTGNTSIVFKTVKEEMLKLVATNIYNARTDSGPITDPTKANFPVGSDITLTFNKDIPADAIVKAALGRNSPLYDTNESISLVETHSDAVVTINPTLDLQENKTYYLRLEITTKDGQPLFKTWDPTMLGNYVDGSLAYVQSGNIVFGTPIPPTANALPSGSTSETSSVLNISNDISSGTVRLGTKYYVQFDKKLEADFADEYLTNDAGLKIKFELVANSSRMLAFWLTGTITPGGGSVYMTDAIGSAADGGKGTINTPTGRFSISNLTVLP